jgi:hypothetical protein
MKAKCANCKTINEFPEDVTSFACGKCGTCQTIASKEGGWGDNACGCILPEGFEWAMPAGKIGGKFIPADGGKPMTKNQYIAAYHIDPEVCLKEMRDLGKDGAEGFKNLSTLGKPSKSNWYNGGR